MLATHSRPLSVDHSGTVYSVTPEAVEEPAVDTLQTINQTGSAVVYLTLRDWSGRSLGR
jgi:hypothetical protein